MHTGPHCALAYPGALNRVRRLERKPPLIGRLEREIRGPPGSFENPSEPASYTRFDHRDLPPKASPEVVGAQEPDQSAGDLDRPHQRRREAEVRHFPGSDPERSAIPDDSLPVVHHPSGPDCKG